MLPKSLSMWIDELEGDELDRAIKIAEMELLRRSLETVCDRPADIMRTDDVQNRVVRTDEQG